MTTINQEEKSTTGLDANLAALVCYVLGFVTGIVMLVIEKDSKFVRFHAMQSVMTFLGLFAINIVLGFIPILGWIVSLLLLPVTLILWLVLM